VRRDYGVTIPSQYVGVSNAGRQRGQYLFAPIAEIRKIVGTLGENVEVDVFAVAFFVDRRRRRGGVRRRRNADVR
jgi:hypothetical protein